MVTVNNALSGTDSDRDQFDRSAVLGLVADVGGTHIRFGIAVGGSAARTPEHSMSIACGVTRFAPTNPSPMQRSIIEATRPVFRRR